MMSCSFTRLGAGLTGATAVALIAGGCGSPGHGPLVGGEDVAVAANAEPAFAVGVTPTMAPPVAMGTAVGFRMSSSEMGYGHLYLINADSGVTMLAENLPLPAGAQVDYPRPEDGIRIRATPPAGIDRLILLVTRQPFDGFTDNEGNTLTRPVGLESSAEVFLEEFNEVTENLPASSWAVAETRVEVVE